jgi:hypothetical protein
VGWEPSAICKHKLIRFLGEFCRRVNFSTPIRDEILPGLAGQTLQSAKLTALALWFSQYMI